MGADPDQVEVAYQTYRDFLIAYAETAKTAVWRWVYGRADSCHGALHPVGYGAYIGRLLELARSVRHEPVLL